MFELYSNCQLVYLVCTGLTVDVNCACVDRMFILEEGGKTFLKNACVVSVFVQSCCGSYSY